MNTKQEQLEAENAALRAVLAAIGEAIPALPADPAKMKLYGLECATRLGFAARTAAALATSDTSGDYLSEWAWEETARLRRQWTAPLHYDAEHPDPRDCTCGHRGNEHIYTAPSPCTQCDCERYVLAVMPGADGEAAAAIVAKAIKDRTPVIVEDES